MRVFISFARHDAKLAAELEAALRRNEIQTSSSLDAASAEEWKRVLDQEGASADGFIFLLGAGASADPELQAEWRLLLRNDWDSRMPLVPVIHLDGPPTEYLPPFLRNRKAIYTTNFDDVFAGQVRDLVRHPTESADRGRDSRAREERENRLNELRNYALALKEKDAGHEAAPE